MFEQQGGEWVSEWMVELDLIILGSYHTRFLYHSDSHFKLFLLSKNWSNVRLGPCRKKELRNKNQHAGKSCLVFRIRWDTSKLQWLLQSCPQLNTSLFLTVLPAASAGLGHEAEVVCIGQVLCGGFQALHCRFGSCQLRVMAKHEWMRPPKERVPGGE